MSQIGREVFYGIGKGADVTASHWINQLSFDFAPKVEYLTNSSAYGVLERTNSATPYRYWSEGSLEAKVTPDNAGLLLLGVFGSVSTADNPDANAVVKDHTFNLTQDMDGQLMTLVMVDEHVTEKYKSARLGETTISFSLDDYLKISSSVMAKKGVTTTATPALQSVLTEFVPKHFAVKTATTTGGLGAASNESTLESFTLTINPNIEADWSAGADEPYGFSSRGYDLSFEMSCRYNSTTYRTAFLNGTELALQITLANTDVIIGTSANPGIVFTAPKFNITDWSLDGDNDSARTQVMTGTIHYSAADAYALRAKLTNTVASYA